MPDFLSLLIQLQVTFGGGSLQKKTIYSYFFEYV